MMINTSSQLVEKTKVFSNGLSTTTKKLTTNLLRMKMKKENQYKRKMTTK
jgi:hypothetical protein